MKRFKNWIHGSLWAVIFGLGLYVLVKGVSIAGGGKNLTRKTAQLYAPVFTLAPVKGTENQSWLSLLTKEVVPLLTYWESKESYFLSEEPQLTVREETDKNPESEKTQETQKSSEVQNTQDQMPQKAEAESMEETEKTVIQKAVKKKKRKKNKKAQTEETKEQQETVNMEELQDFQTLVGNYYTVDASTTADPEQINAEKLAGQDLRIKKDASVPQILIYHTHSQETFADSRPGERADTVIGLGDDLQELLEKQYGYEVLHITEAFDMKEGCLERSRAYNYAEPVIAAALEEHPSIQVVIDLHRDGVNGSKRLVTEINGKPTAQIMFFNGLSRTKESGELTSLPNPYQAENLAFSFQMEYEAEQYYPGFSRCIYLKGYRYNLHLRPRSVLLEVGAQTNTVEEVKNAMGPFSDILHKVLSGKSPASGG